jgi:hypothetical protein
MRRAVFLILRLICYLAFIVLLAGGIALTVVSVNGQCPPINDFAVTCATRFSELLANFGLSVLGISLDTGVPIVLAVGGVIFLMRDARRFFSRAPS